MAKQNPLEEELKELDFQDYDTRNSLERNENPHFKFIEERITDADEDYKRGYVEKDVYFELSDGTFFGYSVTEYINGEMDDDFTLYGRMKRKEVISYEYEPI